MPANYIEFALERKVIGKPFASSDEDLFYRRFRGLGGRSQTRVVCGNDAPSKNPLPFLAHYSLEHFLALETAVAISGQKYHANRVAAIIGQFDPGFAADLDQKLVWRLKQDARAVAGVLLGAASASMLEIE